MRPQLNRGTIVREVPLFGMGRFKSEKFQRRSRCPLLLEKSVLKGCGDTSRTTYCHCQVGAKGE